MENVDIVGIVKRAKPKKIYSVSDLIELKKQQEFIQKTTILDLESKKSVIDTIEFIQKLVFSNSMIIDDNQTERQLIRQYQRFDNWLNIVDTAIKNEIMDMDKLRYLQKRLNILRDNTVHYLINKRINDVDSKQKMLKREYIWNK